MNDRDYALMQQLVTRLCHDLAGVSGTVLNGLEMLRESLAEGLDPASALDITEQSARIVAARVKFFRAVICREGPLTGVVVAAALTRDYL